jgi:hypothetical protein
MYGRQTPVPAALKLKRQKWWQAAAGDGIGPAH